MNKIFNKIVIAAVIAGFGLGVTSCDLDEKPENWYVPSTFWQNKAQFEGNITALSEMFRKNYTEQIEFGAGEIRGGGLYIGTLADGSGSANADYIQQLYDATHCQYNTFGGWYGFIAGLNDFIYNAEKQEGILDDNTRDGLLAMVYGWRAFCYFQMYRMYGGLPLRTEPDVILGEYDPTKLYKARSTAEETLKLIKADIEKSIGLFETSTYVYNSSKKAYYWNKAASEMLAGQVYLWSAKVATEDHALGGEADVRKAKEYFQKVVDGGYALMDDFFDISSPLNKETIFSVCASSLSDKWFYTLQTNFNWGRTTGAATGKYWSNMGDDNWTKTQDGVVNIFGSWSTKAEDGTITTTNSKIWNKTSLGVQRYMYKNAFYYQFDKQDSRLGAFYPLWELTGPEEAMGLKYSDDFDEHAHKMIGTFMVKFRYSELEGYQYIQPVFDLPIYRLPDALFGLAECANYFDEKTEVAKYINMIRERAYGDNWDAAVHGYTPGDFKTNEIAILQESDKEFFFEGRRWWYLRRLTVNKGGAQTDHLVFQPEGCIGHGLPVANSPWMVENDGTVCQIATPVLSKDQEYKLLWPVDQTLLNSDPEIKQNPGY